MAKTHVPREHHRIAERERARQAAQPRGYRMATVAHHNMGDISRDKPDLCYIHGESGDDFIGEWETGFGFVNVRFPKATTRKLTPAERDYYQSRCLAHSNGIVQSSYEIPDVDVDGPAGALWAARGVGEE